MKLIRKDGCDPVPSGINYFAIGKDISLSPETRPHCFPNPVTGYTKNELFEADAVDRMCLRAEDGCECPRCDVQGLSADAGQ